MASKKKNPSFEIPDAVRRAGQSGWVYRSEPVKGSPRGRVPAPRPRTPPAVVHATPRHATAEAAPTRTEAEAVMAPAPADQAADPGVLSTGVIGLGLHVAAVPLIVPLYLTAAISRKLGLLAR